jgi:hypothetical protein
MTDSTPTGHTPGDWLVAEDFAATGHIESDFGLIATVAGHDNPDDETLPNAHLLAGAPAIYRVLLECLVMNDKCGNSKSDFERWERRARAAIAAATPPGVTSPAPIHDARLDLLGQNFLVARKRIDDLSWHGRWPVIDPNTLCITGIIDGTGYIEHSIYTVEKGQHEGWVRVDVSPDGILSWNEDTCGDAAIIDADWLCDPSTRNRKEP